MAISDRLSSLRERLGPSRPAEDERLLQLYWNRAELKKELVRLQGERDRLLELIQRQEGIALKQREQMERLEQYLGEPDNAVHALVYFQLRSLWRTGAAKVAQFSEQLRRQQEERERRRQLIEFDQAKCRQLADIDAALSEAKLNVERMEARLKQLEARLGALKGFWNYFRRRRTAEEISTLRSKWDVAVTQVTDLSDDRADIESREAPPFAGMSVEGRRMVNTAVIAFAQHLTLNLSTGGLAMLAKETATKQVFDMRFGSREDCIKLMEQLKEAMRYLERQAEDLRGLKQSTEALRAAAVYRSDVDTIPLTDSIGTLPPSSATLRGAQSIDRAAVNVLVDDYWEVYRALLQ